MSITAVILPLVCQHINLMPYLTKYARFWEYVACRYLLHCTTNSKFSLPLMPFLHLFRTGESASRPCRHGWTKHMAAFLQSSSAVFISTSRRTYSLIPMSRKGQCLPFPSGASELPVKGCTMQSWQSLGVHLWTTVLNLRQRRMRLPVWFRFLICHQRRPRMRLSWEDFSLGHSAEMTRLDHRWVKWDYLIRWNIQGEWYGALTLRMM